MATEVKPKTIRRKVVSAEPTYGRVPGWIVDLECGHFTEVIGWGSGAGIKCHSDCLEAAKKHEREREECDRREFERLQKKFAEVTNQNG